MPWNSRGFLLFYNAVRGVPLLARAHASLHALETPARKRRDARLQLEPRDARGELRHGESGALGELLEGNRIERHRVEHRIARCPLIDAVIGGLRRPSELRKDVARVLDELRPFLDEPMATLGERRMDGSGDREDVAVLLERAARRREGSARERRLHHQDPFRHSTDQTIAAWEVPGARRRAERKFGHEAAIPRERGAEVPV